MKKLMALVLAMVMGMALLAGCNSTPSSSESGGGGGAAGSEVGAGAEINRDAYADEGEGIYPSADELPAYKMGVLLWGYTDVLGSSVKRNLEYIGEQFNVEMVFAEGLALEDYVNGTENLIQSGCDAIISLVATAGQIEACENAGVYLVQMLNEIADDATRASAGQSEYFVGSVTENDEECGRMMVRDLYEQGCRNIVYIAYTPGSANHDNRVRGIEAELENYPDMNLLTNYRGNEMAEALQSFAATYPEMDGIILTGGVAGTTEMIYQVMQSEGLAARGVKLATIDIAEGTRENIEAGNLSWIAGGQFPTTGIAFTLVYNALQGDKILADPSVTMYRNFMVIQSVEEYDQYVQYVEGSVPPYNGDELKHLIKAFNPDADEALYQQYAESYSIDDVVARHG